jgi:hypothetical protein
MNIHTHVLQPVFTQGVRGVQERTIWSRSSDVFSAATWLCSTVMEQAWRSVVPTVATVLVLLADAQVPLPRWGSPRDDARGLV